MMPVEEAKKATARIVHLSLREAAKKLKIGTAGDKSMRNHQLHSLQPLSYHNSARPELTTPTPAIYNNSVDETYATDYLRTEPDQQYSYLINKTPK